MLTRGNLGVRKRIKEFQIIYFLSRQVNNEGNGLDQTPPVCTSNLSFLLCFTRSINFFVQDFNVVSRDLQVENQFEKKVDSNRRCKIGG